MAKKKSSASKAARLGNESGSQTIKKHAVAGAEAATAADAPPDGPMRLEDVIIALQKTFSRVNEQTQANLSSNASHPDARSRPTALISGLVQFTLSAQVAPATDKKQTLNVAAGGPMTVMLQGAIDTDVKVHDVFATPPAGSTVPAESAESTTTPPAAPHGHE